MSHWIDNHPILNAIPGYAMTKEQHDQWVNQTGRAVTDPWISLRMSKHQKSTSPDVSARNTRELVKT